MPERIITATRGDVPIENFRHTDRAFVGPAGFRKLRTIRSLRWDVGWVGGHLLIVSRFIAGDRLAGVQRHGRGWIVWRGVLSHQRQLKANENRRKQINDYSFHNGFVFLPTRWQPTSQSHSFVCDNSDVRRAWEKAAFSGASEPAVLMGRGDSGSLGGYVWG